MNLRNYADANHVYARRNILLCGATVLILAIVALCISGSQPQRVGAQQLAGAKSLVFDGVTVIDVETGKLIPAQRVVIVGNRIHEVGAAQSVKVPKSAQIVDARGKYLIPGLWDMHAHPDPASNFSLFHSLFIANGITGVRIPYLATASVEEQLQWRKEVRAGTQVGPRQLLAGKTLNEFASSWGRDPVVVQHAMDSLRTIGLDFFKIYPLSPSTFYLAAAARRLGIPFGGHVDDISAVEASDNGITIIDHLNSAGDLDKRCFPKSGGSIEQCRKVAEVFRRNGTAFVPTLTVFANYKIGSFLNASLPIFKRLRGLARQFWMDSLPSHGNWLRDPASVASVASVQSGFIPDTMGVLYIAQQVGLPILAGTDLGPGNVRTMPAGFSLHAELAMSVAEGLTPLIALQSATLNPAKILHATDSLGTVASGKLADLVLLDANPLDDITNTTTIRAVVANGRYFDRAALDSLLTQVQAKGP